MKIRCLASLAFIFCSPGFCEPITSAQVQKAQVEMLNRVDVSVKLFAEKVKIEPWYISYCKSQMNLETVSYPKNGVIPLGVDYSMINDSERLELVIGHREAFETGYMQLCLANAKNALNAALKKP